jgi:hypothetical protein
MTQTTRACLDCGTDITQRHWRAQRCSMCARARELEQLRHKPHKYYDHICEQCGVEFRSRVKRQRFCGVLCSGRWSHPGNIEQACIVCGALFSISVQYKRDTCSRPCTKWAKTHPGELPASQCLFCHAGMAGKRSQKDAIYCSRRCSMSHRNRITGKVTRPLEVTYVCLKCGKDLTGRALNTQYCSRACQAREQQERRSRKQSAAPVEVIRHSDIFDRDKWICHICRGPVDRSLRNQHPGMMSLDHIIPVNDRRYPGHVWENLALAHLHCNIAKAGKATLDDWSLYYQLQLERYGKLTVLS